jgi:hypothetical protein
MQQQARYDRLIVRPSSKSGSDVGIKSVGIKSAAMQDLQAEDAGSCGSAGFRRLAVNNAEMERTISMLEERGGWACSLLRAHVYSKRGSV